MTIPLISPEHRTAPHNVTLRVHPPQLTLPRVVARGTLHERAPLRLPVDTLTPGTDTHLGLVELSTRDRILEVRTQQSAPELLVVVFGRLRLSVGDIGSTPGASTWELQDRGCVIVAASTSFQVSGTGTLLTLPASSGVRGLLSPNRSAHPFLEQRSLTHALHEAVNFIRTNHDPHDAEGGRVEARSLIELVTAIVRSSRTTPSASRDGGVSQGIVRAATVLIREHCHDPKFDALELARRLNVSQRTLYRAYRAAESTPLAALRQERVRRATMLAAELSTGRGLKNVALASGFTSTTRMQAALRSLGLPPLGRSQ